MRRLEFGRTPQAARIAALLCACLLLALPHAAIASPDADDIVVVAFEGDVQITSAGKDMAPRGGAIVALAAAIRTGSDGSIDLRQGDTTIGVGPATQLEFPVSAEAGPIDRVSQPSGNAYYGVGPRGGRKLRVETPYLVAVIKGTQFNVAVTPDSSTISLHEGRLEILATEAGIAPVILNAGEVAVRRKGETEIRVLKVGGGTAASAGSAGDGSSPLAPGGGDPGIGADLPTLGDDSLAGDGNGDGMPALPDDVGVIVDTGIGSGMDDIGSLAAPGVDLGVDLGANAGVASVSAGIDAGIDLGNGTIDAGVTAGVDAGIANVDAGVGAGIDLGAGTVDVGVDVGAGLGAADVGATVDAGVDLGSGTVDVGVGADIDAGAVDAGVTVDAGVDVPAGSVDAGVDAGVAGVDVGVDAGVDLSGSDAGINVGINVLGTEVDLGLGGGGNAPAEAPTDAGRPGGILGGILGRPRS
jgi:FecR protein